MPAQTGGFASLRERPRDTIRAMGRNTPGCRRPTGRPGAARPHTGPSDYETGAALSRGCLRRVCAGPPDYETVGRNMSDGHRPTDAPAPSRRSGPEKRRVTVRPDGTPLPRPTVHAPGSTCGADAQEARRPNVSRGPCSRPRPRLSAAAIVRQDRAPRRRPGPPADAMASLDACVPQPGHKVKMHAWMAAARWRLGMPGTRNVPPAPPLSAPTGKIRPFFRG